MSFAFSIDIGNTVQKLDGVIPAISNALLAGAIHVKGAIAQYPAQSHPTRKSVYGSSFASDRQRRWFFAVGIHQTPYGRTTNLAKHWAIESSMDGWMQIVSNNTIYGPYVQGATDQSLYHRAQGWQTVDQVAENENDIVVNMVLLNIQRVLR